MPKNFVFSNTITPRKFEYQNDNCPDIKILTEKKLNQSKDPMNFEYTGFRKLNFYELPDSRRTLIPELGVNN